MATKKQIAIVEVMCNTRQAVEMLNEYKRLATDTLQKIEQKTARVNEIKAKGTNATKAELSEMKKLSKELKADTAEFNKYNSATQKGIDSHRKLSAVMKDLSGSKLKDLKAALRDLNKMMGDVSNKTPRRAKVIQDSINKVQAQINKLQGTTKSFGATHNSVWSTAVRNITAYVGVMAGFNKVKSLVENVFSANFKLSDSLADIRKVSGLTMQEINQLYTNIARIDTRNTIETLNQLAYTGAKLGIGQNYGVQGLTGFVKAAEQVQMALGEDMGTKALPELAKMTEVMGLIDNYGVEQAMQKTASAIFQLGATSTATGTNIVEFSKRLYGLANVSNISTDELLALGSAADAMGLMPEVAATAFNKLFTSLQRNHNLIEKTLSIPPGTINELYSAGKTMDAIVMIFEKMKEKGNLNALGGVFKDLGSDGARLVNVMATMSDRVDILRKHLRTSTEAFKEGEAVIAEYMIQNETAAATMERAGNIWIKAFANPEGVDMVKELADEWYRLSKEMTQNNTIMWQLRSSLQGIALVMETLIRLAPFLIHALAFAGILATVRSVYFGIVSLITAIRTATTAQLTLNAAMKSNVVLAVVSAVAALAAMWYEAAKAEEWEAEREREHRAELQKALAASKEAIEDSVRPLKAYKAALDDANMSEKERMELVKDFKGDYQDYLDYLGIEINTVDELAAAYSDVVKIMKQKRAYEERENYRDRVNGENKMSRIAAGAEVERELKKMKADEGIDKAWIMSNQNLGTKNMYDAIMKKTYGRGAVEIKGTGLGRWQAPDSNGKMREVTNIPLWNALTEYIVSIRSERDLNKNVDEMFKDEVGDFDIDKWNEERMKNRLKRKGGLENEKPDKEALKEARKAEQEAKQALRKELQDAKQESDAVISKIEEWYRLQETVITDMAADGKLTQEQAEQVIRTLNIAKNTALRDARLAISGRDTEAWEQTKQQIGELMLDQGKWSQELLQQILNVSMEGIRNNLSRIDKGGGKYGITTTSLKDAVDKNAAGNQREISRLMNKGQQEVEKILQEYNYIEVAMQGFSNRLAQMGILTETARHMAERLADAGNAETLYSMKDYNAELVANEMAKRNALESFISSGAKPYNVNPEDETDLREWFMEFVGSFVEKEGTSPYGEGIPNAEYQFHSWAEAFKDDFNLWLSDSTRYKDEIQAFYFSLIKSEEEYYEARKKAYSHEKKQQENRFRAAGYTEEEERTDKQIETQGKLKDAGIGQSLAEQLGIGSIANDPEIQRIQNRIYWRNMEYEDIKMRLEQRLALQQEEMNAMRLRNATEEEIENLRLQHMEERAGLEDLLKERQTNLMNETMNLTTSIAQQMRKRVEAIKTLVKPVTDFTQAAGRKIGDMIFNMESESATWEELWKNMALAVGEAVIEMGAQYMQNYIMQQSINKASEEEAITDATVKTTAGIAAGSAKTIGELGWWGIPLVAVISALLMGLLQAALSTNRSNNNTAKAKTNVKLASGMLTYDEGNVGIFASRRKLYDDGTTQVYSREDQPAPYLGQDGQVYMATPKGNIPEGVSLVRKPIATTVNGQPALVAEKGPEIVIGRKTTQRLMMDEPRLLHHLAMLGNGNRYSGYRGLRTFDEGNVGETVPYAAIPSQPSSSERDSAEREAMMQTLAQLTATVAALQGELAKGIKSTVDMYGRGGLDESMTARDKFRRRYRD